MKITHVVVASVIVTLLSSTAWAQAVTFSEAEIQAAIVAGRKFNHAKCVFTGGPFYVQILTPLGRVGRAAGEAARRYQSFDRASVTDEMLRPMVTVSAQPHNPHTGATELLFGKLGSVLANRPGPLATHVVLRSKGKRDVVLQPAKIEVVPVEWGNAAGGKVTGQGVVAEFDIAAVAALPRGDVDIVIVANVEEGRCTLGMKDRTRLHLVTTTGSTP